MADIRDPRLLGHDPMTGITEYFHWDDETKSFQVESRQNVSPIVEKNLAIRNEISGTRFGEFNLVASVPNTVVVDLMNRGIWADKERYAKWLDSEEAQPYRTRKCKVWKKGSY